MDIDKPFGWRVAERIFKLVTSGDNLELRADGIYLSKSFAEVAWCIPTFLWTPQCATLDADPQDAPLLPIPFSGRDLAAFSLNPATSDVRLNYIKENLSGVQDGFVLRAVEEAQQEFMRAEKIVGSLNNFLLSEAERLADEYNQQRDLNRALLGISNVTNNGLTDDEYSERIDLANSDVAEAKAASLRARRHADEYEIDWRNRMVLAIYERAGTVTIPMYGSSAPAHVSYSPVTAAPSAPLTATHVDAGTAPNNSISASNALWRLKKIDRADDLRLAIHAHLERADRTASPPTARVLLDTWLINKPPRITRVHVDSLEYPASGPDGEKTANIRQIQHRINNLVERIHSR
jgi:hypothetical protein